MNIQQVKQRFGIIGNDDALNRAIEIAIQVAPTNISALISGESGTGKEVMPQIIHQYSHRKHKNYIAVNCGAIPEGTIDSELFGHEKGAFTGATDSRKGYFQVADGGTIFLDEVGELPLNTQVRLLRVLETGEFIRVGSSKTIKTDIRVVAAAHKNLLEEIKKGKFREDLFYRLNTIPIHLAPLRERKDDIHLLFRKFSVDFSEKYRMPAIRLSDEAVTILTNYRWPGNIRQLKNVAEQISVIESQREVDERLLLHYLPHEQNSTLPMVIDNYESTSEFDNDMDKNHLYKMLVEMRKDLNDVKRVLVEVLENQGRNTAIDSQEDSFSSKSEQSDIITPSSIHISSPSPTKFTGENISEHEEIEENLSLEETEIELIKKALKKHRGKRKYAAQELGISERTLYRKIKEFDIT